MNNYSPHEDLGDLAFWDSSAELAAALGASVGPVVRLPDPHYTARWATASIDGIRVVFSLDREDQRPKATRAADTALIVLGFNDVLVGLDVRACRIAFEFDFGTPFYDFVSTVRGAVVALFETGVASVAPSGTVLWRYDSDLIVEWRERDGALFLTFADDASACLDLESGRPIP